MVTVERLMGPRWTFRDSFGFLVTEVLLGLTLGSKVGETFREFAPKALGGGPRVIV